MKLFWKIFFSTMFISVSCLALGGYLLITSNLNALLEREVQTAYDYGDMISYALAGELQSADSPQELDKAASSINISSMKEEISFGLVDEKGTVIYSALPFSFDGKLRESLKGNERGWMIRQGNEHMFLQAIRPIQFQEETCYVETLRDVTSIFDGQNQQYETLLRIMTGMLFLAGLLTFLISRLLTGRIISLNTVTREISTGNLSRRADARGNDEIATLSVNFNRMADQLEEKIENLQEEAIRKERFVGAFAHELKTPLTSIIGYADTIRRKQMDAQRLKLCADYIFSEGKRLESLSMRLLDLMVLKNEEIYYTPVDVRAFLDGLCQPLIPVLEASGINLTYELEPGIIPMEPELMKTVFLNLIDNARKAMEQGGAITVTGRLRENAYFVSLQDTGRGIPAADLSHITEAFYMADKSRARKQGGTGLGLSICDEILKLHGFGISFESTMNVGTTVTVQMNFRRGAI